MARFTEKHSRKLVQHGKHIFLFWNIQTQQVLYSFFPGVEKAHIKQLPFIGKKSVPADIRPDFWKPYCTVTFPTSYQGLIAFRKLREFRKLHELSWDKTQPELLQLSKKNRIRALMDQRANSIADLAKVLAIQGDQASYMQENIEKQRARQIEFLERRWAEVEELAQKREEIKRLEKDLKSLKESLPRKVSEKEKERVEKAIRLLTHRWKKLKWAQRIVAARDEAETRAPQLGITGADVAIEGVETTESSSVEGETTEAETPISSNPRTNISNPITTSLLPKNLSKALPQPFSLNGITIEWADLYDAEYAPSWPSAVTHDTMGITSTPRRPPLPGVTKLEFPKFEEEELAKAQAAALAAREQSEKDKVEEAHDRRVEGKWFGAFKYLPRPLQKVRNPLKFKALHPEEQPPPKDLAKDAKLWK